MPNSKPASRLRGDSTTYPSRNCKNWPRSSIAPGSSSALSSDHSTLVRRHRPSVTYSCRVPSTDSIALIPNRPPNEPAVDQEVACVDRRVEMVSGLKQSVTALDGEILRDVDGSVQLHVVDVAVGAGVAARQPVAGVLAGHRESRGQVITADCAEPWHRDMHAGLCRLRAV